ncbi:MAG: DNA mismatch endonuclease Vsr [Pirellulales bacterium]
MTDHLTSAKRSWNMARITSNDTVPERQVRSTAHRLGFRFRLRCSHLPGKPDLVFPRHRKAVFVHGCFWHSHRCKRGGRTPKSNGAYWRTKLKRNRERDRRNTKALQDLGWRVLIVWECEAASPQFLVRKLTAFFREQ